MFSFNSSKDSTAVSSKTIDLRRCEFQNLEMIIIDEISMVKSDHLYLLDSRLQSITLKDVPFGGVSLFCFGDLMQLKPIMGHWIFEEPSNNCFTETHLLDPRWKMFTCVVLEKNHRQGADKEYADLLNKIRIGRFNDEDLKPLLESETLPRKAQFMRFIAKHPLPENYTWYGLKNKFKMKITSKQKAEKTEQR